MKTSAIKALAAIVISLFMFGFTPHKQALKGDPKAPEAKATCPYFIDNQICKITVDIDIFTIPNCSGPPCISYTGITIPASTVYQIICNGCTNVCNIVVTVTSINGVPVTPGPADFSNGYTNPVPLCCGGCTSNGILYAGTPSVFKVY